jgi:hypothetical protein
MISVYEIKNAKRYADPWENPGILDRISLRVLTQLTGCDIYLAYTADEGGKFWGGTNGQDCPYGNGGWVDSDTVVKALQIDNHDTMYNADGSFAGGVPAEMGGYLFDLIVDFPL